MGVESENQSGAEEGPAGGALGSAAKLLLMAGSLGAASVAGVYVHPHLLPLATEQVPQLWGAMRGWMTPPVLFLLLNVVVGTLYASSTLMCKGQAEEEEGRPLPPALAESVAGIAAAAAPPGQATGVAASPPSQALGLRARLGKSTGLNRLVRSKSEQIPAVSLKADIGAAGRLKKAGTFETSPRAKLKPVVVVADPPDDAPAGHEEVDKKAEAFISRFYQKVKLQRLDSLLRQQRQQQQQQQLHL